MELLAEQKRCLDCLVTSIRQLGGQVEPDRLEYTAELIIQTMRGPWRYFHTSEHIFEVGGVSRSCRGIGSFISRHGLRSSRSGCWS